MSEIWLIEPRDPLVLGNGLPTGSAGAAALSLHPGTLAGMVRSCFVVDRSQVHAEEALGLLDIRLRGPWLVREHPTDRTFETLVPAPCDRAARGDVFQRARLLALCDGEGLYWGGAPLAPDPSPTYVTGYGDDPHEKSRSSEDDAAVWPLDAAVRWALGGDVLPGDVKPPDRSGDVKSPDLPLGREQRTHVAIDNDTGTAAPAQLFTSHGLRPGRNVGIALEVTAPAGSRPPSTAVVLGGEARLSFRSTQPEAALPSFARFQADYQAAARTPGLRGLRIQLLTPACFHAGAPAGTPAWRPPALADFQLVAMCVPGFQAISGWNLQDAQGRGAPRAVRRLVPAGSVYWYEWRGDPKAVATSVLDRCEALWAQPIDGDRPLTDEERAEFRAPPARDGHSASFTSSAHACAFACRRARTNGADRPMSRGSPRCGCALNATGRIVTMDLVSGTDAYVPTFDFRA